MWWTRGRYISFKDVQWEFWLQIEPVNSSAEPAASVLKFRVASFSFWSSSEVYFQMISPRRSSGGRIRWINNCDNLPAAGIHLRDRRRFVFKFHCVQFVIQSINHFLEGTVTFAVTFSAAGVGNTALPWSIVARSVVQLYRSASLSVFLIMYRQKPGEWPDFTVCQRLHGQCGPMLQLASEQLHETLVTAELGPEPSHMTHRIPLNKLLGGKKEHSPQFNLVFLLWFLCTLQLLLPC